MQKPYISVVIPIHNEEEVLEILYKRLLTVMNSINKSFEIIFINDGSKDNSETILREFHQRRPNEIRVINFNGNFGQHMAIMAGFERVRGDIVITMDADLQNPPEEIPKFIAEMEKGHDVVGGYRQNRKDHIWRKMFSRLHNIIRAKIAPQLKMKDEGCMLRAFRRNIVEAMTASGEASTFIPALALTYANNPSELPVAHEERAAGTTSYNFYKLIRYNFDLITGFSLVPLQLFTLLGTTVSILSGILVVDMIIRRIFIGPEAQGVFTLFAIMFFLVGLCLLGLGILGEYIGRIYQEVRRRPRFIIRSILEKDPIGTKVRREISRNLTEKNKNLAGSTKFDA
jgi:undecaprenyl-phosphate 4-deoxy-4-formamido-L-arabinose transferase